MIFAGQSALRLLEEWPLAMSLATTLVFLVFGKSLLADLSHPVRFTFILTWLLLIILFSVFAVVRHADIRGLVWHLSIGVFRLRAAHFPEMNRGITHAGKRYVRQRTVHLCAVEDNYRARLSE